MCWACSRQCQCPQIPFLAGAQLPHSHCCLLTRCTASDKTALGPQSPSPGNAWEALPFQGGTCGFYSCSRAPTGSGQGREWLRPHLCLVPSLALSITSLSWICFLNQSGTQGSPALAVLLKNPIRTGSEAGIGWEIPEPVRMGGPMPATESDPEQLPVQGPGCRPPEDPCCLTTHKFLGPSSGLAAGQV